MDAGVGPGDEVICAALTFIAAVNTVRFCGGEPVFVWNGDAYGVCFADTGYCIARIDGTCEKLCSTADSVLEYLLDGDRLRDIITKVTVISRNI